MHEQVGTGQELQSDHASYSRTNVISETLTVASLLVPDGLIWLSLKSFRAPEFVVESSI